MGSKIQVEAVGTSVTQHRELTTIHNCVLCVVHRAGREKPNGANTKKRQGNRLVT